MIVYRELSSLEQDLGFSAKTLYAVSNSLDKHYRTASIPKKNGGIRKLWVPDELLKAIQHQITEVLILPRPISRYAKAYYPGSSTIRNAKHHVGQSVVLKLDILHFFDSIRYSDVKDLVFPSEIYAEPLRILLTMLCYHRDALPQGAPSSPAITNIIMAEFDEIVGRHCTLRGIRYTRYCDDMTFSGSFDPESVIVFVREELKKRGFLLNEQKTRIQRSGTRQSVTGIVVNEKLSVPADYRRKLRQELHYTQAYGVSGHLRRIGADTPEEVYLHQLLGRVNYVLQVSPNDNYFQQAQKWLRDIQITQISLREAVLSMAQDRYGTEAEYLFAKYPGFAVLRHPNKKWYGIVMDLSREKLGLPGEGMVDVLNVKCDPIMSGSLRLQPGILPGYHMNKERWITIVLDGTVDLEQIGILLDISYDIVGAKPPKKIKQIKEEPLC